MLPQFGRTVIQADAPPPLSGGTLLVTEDGVAVAADPDRDQVYVVTLSDRTVKKVFLGKHDEPGRVVVDDAGRAHVVLRRGGAVATIDIATGTLLARRDVCPAPRGIAFDKNRSRLLVACADGQVAALPPAPDGAKVAFTTLERDLRDVVVLGDRIFVSQFRSAKIFELTTEGVLQASIAVVDDPMVEATLAWRMISPSAAAPVDASTGDDTTLPVVLHQLASRAPLSTSPGGYGGNGSPGGGDVDGCQIHKSTTSMLRAASDRTYLLPTNVVLPVDVAKVKAGYAVVAAGNGHTPGLAQVYVIASDRKSIEDGVCNLPIPVEITGQATSVAAYQDSFVVQSREPASLVIPPTNLVIPLDDTSREDTGHAIFHSNSGAGLACASCHGEGGDDGHVWDFDKIGTRRTPSMHGTLAGTAPYHWNGEESDLGRLTDDVMTGRMSGPVLAQDQKNALQSWLFALPAPAKSGILDDLAVARGKSLFQDSNVGCSTCHSGAQFTNSMTVDVGTGGAFQVPPLVGVGARAPFLHDGCATTLRDRFGACGGGDFHGHTSSLTDTQIGDLIAYLESL
ncbi:surface antigen protein [Labilithrix luteola]|uniref:Surface antigen protein n=1 Tax=Labilithrix luteola TaxID=1391654 RepID=A0A0K1PLD6_9BACT|nr:surface antigen protein [Labilithrix luteola]